MHRQAGLSPQDTYSIGPYLLREALHGARLIQRTDAMPKFVIERDIAGAGKLPKQELQAISQKSCNVLHSMGPTIQWVQSYVTDDKIYCLYVAPDEETVRMHAQKGGFPADAVARVRAVIEPTTAEGPGD
jgi:hypothetical protein